MKHPEIYNLAQLTELIQQIGFLPLLDSGIRGYSAEGIVNEDCRYVTFSDGGWDCRIVTEDFVYPRDKHGHEYGWSWSLITTAERLYGKEICRCPRTPEESLERMLTHFRNFLPEASDSELMKMLK